MREATIAVSNSAGEPGRVSRTRSRGELVILSLILVVAFAARLGYAWYEQRTIPHGALATIPYEYEPGAIAYSLATGNGFSSPFRWHTGPTAWTTPVYPLLFAGLIKLFHPFSFQTFVAAALLNIVFSALTCVPVFYAGKRVAGTAVAAGAALLWAVFPNAVVIPFQWIWDTSLSGLLAAALVWATLAFAGSRRLRDWCSYGALWGLALMTNATLLAGLPFMLGWMACRNRKLSDRWLVGPALAAAVIVLACIPWTVRNYVVLHAFVPFRSVLGLQLWLGNNDQYRDNFPGWMHPVDNPGEFAKYQRLGEIAYMRQKREAAIEWIMDCPRRDAELFKARFIATWLGTPHPVKDFLRADSFAIRAIFIANFLAAVGALVGLFILLANGAYRPYFVLLASLPLLFPVAFYMSQALFRYRYPIDPIVLLLAAIGGRALVPGRWLNRRASAREPADSLVPLAGN
jgi:Dolichyl-phosphate-mannose-protein mannosyltransferase